MNDPKIHRTRFPSLAYILCRPGLWRFVDAGDLPRLSVVGPQYRTKAELLADLTRYARENWGEA